VGVLAADQELGVVALGVHRVRCDHAPGQVQRFQQRREPGDLIGLAVHAHLREDGAGVLVAGRQQVDGLPICAGVTGAAQRLAVHGQHLPLAPAAPWPLAGGAQPRRQPGPHRGLERARIDPLQDSADGGLIRRLKPPGQRVTADTETGQDMRRRIRHPLADRGKRPCSGQHGRYRCQ
jgi:hypothetical protein